MIPTTKRLQRTREDAQTAGVFAGLGDYLGLDPVVLRLTWVALTIFTGGVPGILTYLAAWIIVPLAPQPVAHMAPQGNGG